MTMGYLTDIEKNTDRLYGLLTGISSDYRLNNEEIFGIRAWLNTHSYLREREPFSSACDLLDKILEVGVIDAEERDELLEWCLMFHSESYLHRMLDTAIRNLHGVLGGIGLDGQVTDDEIIELRDWLFDYERFKDYWPFSVTWDLIEQIFSDGKIDQQEREEMLDFCKHFSETPTPDAEISDPVYKETYMETKSPIFQPFTALCNREAKIKFNKNTFCFTGSAKTGLRKELHKIVEKIGGVPKNSVIKNLNYLVIGAQSSPFWVYSTYGRKIEEVIENRRNKRSKTIILHEDDFLAQAMPLYNKK